MKRTDPLLVDVPMPITTPRLVMRPSQAGDGAALAEAKRESWPELNRWLPFAEGPVESVDDEADEAYARKKHADFILRDHVWLLAFARDGGGLVGTADYHAVDWHGRIMSMGYWVRTGETGKGYATEMGNALLRYAFGALAATRVAVGHADGNLRSQRVIEKLGFDKEGVVRGAYFLNGKPSDAHYYARLDLSGLAAMEASWPGARQGC